MIKCEEQSRETARLYLREYNQGIADKIFTTYTDEELQLFFGYKSNEEIQLEKERHRQGMSMYGRSFSYFHLIEKSSLRVLGWCGFHTIYTNHNRAELGYVLNYEEYKRLGYMKEALPSVIAAGFEKYKLHRIEAFIGSENSASYKLLFANGFIKEGLLREHYYVNGKYEDSILFSLIKSDIL